MNFSFRLFILLSCPFIVSCSCNRKETQPTILQGIRPPYEKYNLPFTEFDLNKDSSYEFHLPTGTNIRIAAGSFVRKNGKPVEGSIRFKVREFHEAGDLLRSGIPMNLADSAGIVLQTDGMIELRAFENEKELELVAGKEVEVALAAKNPSDSYNLYYFNQDKNWKTSGNFTTQPNNRKKKRLERLLQLKENSFRIYPERKDLYVDLIADYSEAPYVEPLTAQLWKIEAKDATEEVIAGLRINWDELKVKELESKKEKKGKYQLEFSSKIRQYDDSTISRQLVVEASPVSRSTGEAIARSALERQLKVYEKKLKELEVEQVRLQAETDLQNKFKVSKLGIWNIDRVMKMEDFVTASVSFDFEKEVNTKLNKIRLFSVFENDRTVLEYLPGQWNKVYLSSGRKMKLLALLPGDQIAVADSTILSEELKQQKELYTIRTKRMKASDYFAEKP